MSKLDYHALQRLRRQQKQARSFQRSSGQFVECNLAVLELPHTRDAEIVASRLRSTAARLDRSILVNYFSYASGAGRYTLRGPERLLSEVVKQAVGQRKYELKRA